MKIALVYDRLNKIGGAERVLRELHQLWPQVPLYTSVYNSHTAPFAKKWQIKPSFLNQIPFARKHHELFPLLMPMAFESFDFTQFDLVISITSAEAKGIITQPKTLHVCYCLTPTRYLYSHKNHYAQTGATLLHQPKQYFQNKLKVWDQVAAQRPDYYLAISQTVQKRIKKYYHRESQIIYPPVDTDFFKCQRSKVKGQKSGYYLIVSRLVSYKNIDLAIKACNQLEVPLKIIGTGLQKRKLKNIAGPTIEFLGQVTDFQLLTAYQNCKALVFPGIEDFGITMIEALSCGKPVIAFNQGGASEIIIHQQNGLLFDKLTSSAIVKQIKTLDSCSFNRQQLRSTALKYSNQRFKQEFKATIEKLWQNHLQNQT